MRSSTSLISTRHPVTGPEVLRLIGNTPLLELRRLAHEYSGIRLFAKAEWCNPGGSVKDRAAASIIADAETRGLLGGGWPRTILPKGRDEKTAGVSLNRCGDVERVRSAKLVRGRRILDASSGNTAVAYAMLGAAKRYPVTLCVPKNANPQVLALLRTYGAEVVLTDPLQGSDGAIREARHLSQQEPERFVYLDQYNNPANWQAHYRTTAPEIWKQTRGAVTHVVAGLGTTGTFTGTSRRLKEFNPAIRAIAVQPDAPLHGLEGLKHLESALVPGIYDPSLPDETRFIATEEADEAVRRLVEQEGLLVGPSAGAALAASLALARELASVHTPAVFVMIFPDSGHRYLPAPRTDVSPAGEHQKARQAGAAEGPRASADSQPVSRW